MSTLTLKNPHSVLAALKTRPSQVQEVKVPSKPTDVWSQVEALARELRIRVSIQQSSSGKSVHGGREGSAGEAQVRPKESVSPEELFQSVNSKKGYGVWLALDQLQDPQNVGSIFRTAGFLAVRGIFLTQERSAPLSASVYDVSAGGVEAVPFCMQSNLSHAIDIAKESDIWVLGTSEHAKESLGDIRLDRNWLVVLGNEEKGLRRLTTEHCDQVVTIPCRGDVTSLNVAVATAMILGHLKI